MALFMQSIDISFVYVIKDIFDEQVFIKNELKNNQKNIIIVNFNNYHLQLIKDTPIIYIGNQLNDHVNQIFKRLTTNWLMFMEPEEVFVFQIKNLKSGSYNILVEKFLNNTVFNSLIYSENKLYHKDYKPNSETEFLDVTVYNYTYFFPEITSNMTKKYLEYYQKNSKDIKIILYLIENRVISLEPEYILQNYYIPNDLSPESLGLLRYIAQTYIQRKDFKKALLILTQAIQNFPNSLCINSLIAEIYFNEKNYKNAIVFAINSVRLVKEKSYYKLLPFSKTLKTYSSHYFVACIFYEMGEYLKAKIAFEEALDNYKDFEPAIDGLKKTIKHLSIQKNYVNEMSFACQGCGNCCRAFNVNITHHDLLKILEYNPQFNVNDIVTIDFNHKNNSYGINLKKRDNSPDCIFLEDNKCLINDYKPLTCSIWPFTLRGNDLVTWETRNRVFIKDHCAYKEEKKSNDKNKIVKNINEYQKQNNKMLKAFQDWDQPIYTNNNTLNEKLIEFFKKL